MIRIQPATVQDADFIAKLFVENTPKHQQEITILGCHGFQNFISDNIKKPTAEKNRFFWLAKHHDEPCGAIEWRKYEGAKFLNNIHVSKQHQGLGVGKKLLQKTLTAPCLGTSSTVQLDVFAENQAALTWYSSMGFSIIKRIHFFSIPLYSCVNAKADKIQTSEHADLQQSKYGFGMITTIGSKTYEVGTLGRNWFRCTDAAILKDPSAKNALQKFDSHRKLLLVTNLAAEIGSYLPIATSIRMTNSY